MASEEARGASSHDIEIGVDAALEEDVYAMIFEERNRFLRRRLLPKLRPAELKVSTDSLQDVFVPPSLPTRPVAAYSVLILYHISLNSRLISPPSLKHLIEWIGKAQIEYGPVPLVRLGGFPPSLLAELASWIEEPSSSEAFDLEDGVWSNPLLESGRKLLSTSEALTWEAEDGTTVIDCSVSRLFFSSLLLLRASRC